MARVVDFSARRDPVLEVISTVAVSEVAWQVGNTVEVTLEEDWPCAGNEVCSGRGSMGGAAGWYPRGGAGEAAEPGLGHLLSLAVAVARDQAGVEECPAVTVAGEMTNWRIWMVPAHPAGVAIAGAAAALAAPAAARGTAAQARARAAVRNMVPALGFPLGVTAKQDIGVE
jgi:hypothetical protein